MPPSPCLQTNPAEKMSMMDPLPQMPQLTRLTRRPVRSETQIPHRASPPQPQKIVPNDKGHVAALTDAGRNIGHGSSHQTIPVKQEQGDWPLQFQPEQHSSPVQQTPFGLPYQRRPPFLPWSLYTVLDRKRQRRAMQIRNEQRRIPPTQVVLPTPALAPRSQQTMHEQNLAAAMQHRRWQRPPSPYPNLPWQVNKSSFQGQVNNPWEPRPSEKKQVTHRHQQQQQRQYRQEQKRQRQEQQHGHHHQHEQPQQHRQHQQQEHIQQQQQQQIQQQQELQEQQMQLRAQHKREQKSQHLPSDPHEEELLIKMITEQLQEEEALHRFRNVHDIQETKEPVPANRGQREDAPDIALKEKKQTSAVYCELQNDTIQPSDDIERQKQQDEIRVQSPVKLPSYKDSLTSDSAKDTFDDGSHGPRIVPLEKDEDSVTPNAIPENSDPVETRKDEEPQPKDYDVDEFIMLVKDSLDESPRKVNRKSLLPIEEFMILLETSMRENILPNATHGYPLNCLPIPETPENFTVEPEAVFVSQCDDLRDADPKNIIDREVKHGSPESVTENVYTVSDSSVSQENIEWLENLIQTTAITLDCQPADGEKTDDSPSAPVEEDSVQTTQKIDGASLPLIPVNHSETKMDVPNSHLPIDGKANGMTEPTIIAATSLMKVDSVVPTNAIASYTKNLALGSSDQSEGTAFHGNAPKTKVTPQTLDIYDPIDVLQSLISAMRKPLQPKEVSMASSPTEQTSALSNSPQTKVSDLPTEDDIRTPPPDPIPLPKAVICFVCLETSAQAEDHLYFGLLECKECSLVISTCHEFRLAVRNPKRCSNGSRDHFTNWTVSPVDFLCYKIRRQLQKEATSGDGVSTKQVVEKMDNYLQALRPLKGRGLYDFAFERCQVYIEGGRKMKRKPKFVVRDGAKKQRIK